MDSKLAAINASALPTLPALTPAILNNYSVADHIFNSSQLLEDIPMPTQAENRDGEDEEDEVMTEAKSPHDEAGPSATAPTTMPREISQVKVDEMAQVLTKENFYAKVIDQMT